MSFKEKVIRERFGRYLILDHLVDGGMAKICRARFLGEEADKVVVIKMIQPQYSKDEAFKTMFMDEIKLTFGLIHPNIIQVYDYGVHDEQLFVAMEYCDGKNLKEVTEKLKEQRNAFPIEICIYITSQVCQALYYAHTFTDKFTGEERGIIHRDISPHNIMLTYDGSVKVIDFGIAKSKTNSESTQVGTIKGKLSYLAPEYLEGYELDPRYDQFAVGITLWEMLCNQKLFKDNNDLAILKKIQECKIRPPSSINPNVPKELDEIVLKALSKNPLDRYDTMDKFNRALMKFLYSRYPDFNSTDLCFFAQELFTEVIKADRLKMYEYGKIDIKPYIDEWKREQSGEGNNNSNGQNSKNGILTHGQSDYYTGTKGHTAGSPTDGGSRESSINTNFGNVSSSPTETLTPRPRETTFDMGFDVEEQSDRVQKTKKLIGKKNKNDDSEIFDRKDFKSQLNGGKKLPSNTNIIELEKSISQKNQNRKDFTKSSMSINQYEVEEIAPSNWIVKVGAMLLILIGLSGYLYLERPKKQIIESGIISDDGSLQSKRNPTSSLDGVTTASTLNKNETTLIIENFDKVNHRAFIDDEPVIPDLVNALKVPLKKPFILRVEIKGKRHFIEKMNLSDQMQSSIKIPDQPPEIYGYLYTSSNCYAGTIYFSVFGEKRKSNLPIDGSVGIAFPMNTDNEGRPKATTHSLELKISENEVSRHINFDLLREQQRVDLCLIIN